MEAMMQHCTDDRLDNLSNRMYERFDYVEGEIRDLRGALKATSVELRGEMHTAAAELRQELKVDRDEFRRFLRTLIQIGGALLLGTLLALLVALLTLLLTGA